MLITGTSPPDVEVLLIGGRRPGEREIGGGLDWRLKRSRLAARWLEAEAPPWVVRVPTDGRSVETIASEALKLAGWIDA